MSLLDLWSSSREQLLDKKVSQVIAFSGSGRLGDGTAASQEFRQFLNHVPSALLCEYADECLRDSFPESGFALQDIVNQVGRRIGLEVTDGKYRGRTGQTGEDGIWRLPDGHAVVIEVKTTDAYRVDLDRLAEFRRILAAESVLNTNSSSHLLIVGRQDTGDLEAQIRGSRHAWDFRVISVDALLRLMKLKEAIDDPQTMARIHAILIPREFTRIDSIVDILFSTAEEVTVDEPADPDGAAPCKDSEREISSGPKFTPVKFHEACIGRLQSSLSISLVKRSRSTYASPDGQTRVICAVSKRHDFMGDESYWFAFHPYYFDFLKASKQSLAAFGCGSENVLFIFPSGDFEPWLSGAYTTERDGKFYWHIQLYREGCVWWFKRRRGHDLIDVTRYLLPAMVDGGQM